MSKYEVILFDADETLFDFTKGQKEALIKTLEFYDIPPSEEIIGLYRTINNATWQRFERNEINWDDLRKIRFTRLFDELGLSHDGLEANHYFLTNLANGGHLLPGAKELCEKLSKTHTLYIVTNGFSMVQHKRFENSEIKPCFADIFVSEDIGYQKPQREYFDYVFEKIPSVDKKNILLVGDSLTSDILGANNAGINSCWFNPNQKENQTNASCTYEINTLTELIEIVNR